jgi:hypothetical protein
MGGAKPLLFPREKKLIHSLLVKTTPQATGAGNAQ